MEIVPQGNRIWKTSFIDPTALIDGKIMLDGDFVYIAPFVEAHSANGDIRIGEGTNIQDSAKLYGPAEIGSSVSLAHRCEISNSVVGDFAFVGFGAKITNSRIRDGAFVSHGAVLNGALIEEDTYVPPCGNKPVGKVPDELREFREDELKINSELVIGYIDLLYSMGERAVLFVAPSPATSWTRTPIFPKTEHVRLLGQTRIIGGVEFAGEASIGEKTSIRGDEGYPIKIKNQVKIGREVVLHSLKKTSIEIGSNVTIGDGSIIHGPAVIGRGATIGKNCILLKSQITDGDTIPDGMVLIENKAIFRL